MLLTLLKNKKVIRWSIFLKFEDIFQEEFNNIWLEDEVKNANNIDNIELFTAMIHFFKMFV